MSSMAKEVEKMMELHNNIGYYLEGSSHALRSMLEGEGVQCVYHAYLLTSEVLKVWVRELKILHGINILCI